MKLPCDQCKGQCCTFPGFSRREFKVVKKKYGIPAIAQVVPIDAGYIIAMEDGTCPYLKNGRCSIYEDRPLVCRAYGTSPALPCKFLYPIEAARAVIALGGFNLEMKKQMGAL
jgi:Fe-S-cluster containining protein